MVYKKKVWKTGDIMKQEDINNIENGIYEAHQELQNLHNYDDTEIKNIIGSGTLSTLAKDLKGAINEVFQSASNGKTLIAQAITGKGVTTSNTDTFQTMATNISLISGKVTGKILTLDNKKYTLSEDDNGNITATIIKFSITNKLTNVSNNNSAIQVDYGNSYSATITANSGYEINSLSITMGGVDITSTVFNNNEINISKVTGDLIISISAKEKVNPQPPQEENPIEDTLEILPSFTYADIPEEGTKNLYVKLSSKPDSNTVVNASSSSQYLSCSPSSLTFTNTNWNTSQKIALTSLKDNDESNNAYDITLSSGNLSTKVSLEVIDAANSNFEMLYNNGALSHGTLTLNSATNYGSYITINQNQNASVMISGYPISLNKNDKVYLELGLEASDPSPAYSLRIGQLGDSSANDISNSNLLTESELSNALDGDRILTYWTVASAVSNIDLTITAYYARVKIYKIYIERG